MSYNFISYSNYLTAHQDQIIKGGEKSTRSVMERDAWVILVWQWTGRKGKLKLKNLTLHKQTARGRSKKTGFGLNKGRRKCGNVIVMRMGRRTFES